MVKVKRELQKEIEFLTNEANQKELESVDVRDKLKKREEELKELKSSLNE